MIRDHDVVSLHPPRGVTLRTGSATQETVICAGPVMGESPRQQDSRGDSPKDVQDDLSSSRRKQRRPSVDKVMSIQGMEAFHAANVSLMIPVPMVFL